MSALSEMFMGLSLIGCLFLFIYWFWKDHNLTRLTLQLLLLVGLSFVLHAIFGFPQALLRPEDATVSKGTEGATPNWPIYVIAYLSMLAGMFCQYLYSRFSREAAQRPPFDCGSFIAPVFVSPIIFLPLCSTLGVGEHAETGRYMIFLIAFENGFFFKGYFDQRAKAGHGHKPHISRFLLLLIAVVLPFFQRAEAVEALATNPALSCTIEPLGGTSVTHYRLHGASPNRIWQWFKTNFPAIFGNTPPFEKSVALLVGVSHYSNLAELKNVLHDLENMRDYLLVQEIFDDVYVLQDENVTNETVNNLMFGYFARQDVVGGSDRFLFYYSGHGDNSTGVGQLQFSHADPKKYDFAYMLPVSEWENWSKSIHAKQALFLFDACALGEDIVTKGVHPPDWELLSALSTDTSRIAFAATRGGEAALGDEDTSFFTFEFLKAVQSADADFAHVGFMTISGIADVMEPKLGQLARQHHRTWRPTHPIPLDDKAYPGTFVFLNPNITKDVQFNFGNLIQSKGQLAVNKTPSASPTPAPSSEFYFQRGLSAFKDKNYNKAISDYTEAIRLNPDDTDLYLNRSAAYDRLAQYDKAISDSTEALRLDPTYASAYNARGLVYIDLKQYEKAIADFTEAVRLKSDDPTSYNNRGHAYDHLKEYEKAVADFTEAIRLEPGNAGYYNDRRIVFDALGEKAKAEQDHKKAEELLSKGHASTPSPTPFAALTSSTKAPKTAPPTAAAEAPGAAPFDGTWSVSLVALDNKNAGTVARGYTRKFVTHVKNGVLYGEQGIKGWPNSLEIGGKIRPDGSADLHVQGFSGSPEYNLGHHSVGTPYEYEVKAHFDGNRGSGSRVAGRIANLTFVKE